MVSPSSSPQMARSGSQAAVTDLVPETLRLDSRSRSGSDSDSGSSGSSDSSDDEGVGRTDGEELYRNTGEDPF